MSRHSRQGYTSEDGEWHPTMTQAEAKESVKEAGKFVEFMKQDPWALVADFVAWVEANSNDLECRSDEDCDHCLLVQLAADARRHMESP
jgi:hypothetical protein